VAPGGRAYSYDRVAWCYDAIARSYSGGAIAASRASQLEHLKPGQRVLYAGVGGGEDAVAAACAGARVTALDVSPRMLKRFGERLEQAGAVAELRCEDLFEHSPARPYDAVVANYFLNIFGESEMRAALERLSSLTAPTGRILLADFAPAGAGELARIGRAIYYRPINVAAWLLGLCELHPIYDYARLLCEYGFALVADERFRVGGRGPELYASWVAERVAAGS
jgi:ubiquinone/menaquinone biosynthesis C-methylase UbiE